MKTEHIFLPHQKHRGLSMDNTDTAFNNLILLSASPCDYYFVVHVRVGVKVNVRACAEFERFHQDMFPGLRDLYNSGS